MYRFIFAILIALSVMHHGTTSAALTSASSSTFGDGSLTIDTEQGLYWLTPNATIGLSYYDVQNLLMTDIRFSGFRVASLSELESLYAHAKIPDINVPGIHSFYGTSENVAGVEFLQSLVGTTNAVHVGGEILIETAGFVGDSFISPINGFQSVYIGNLVLHSNVATRSGFEDFASAFTTWGSSGVHSSTAGVGTWLVSSVPEPSVWAAMLLGILIIGVARLRTKWNSI